MSPRLPGVRLAAPCLTLLALTVFLVALLVRLEFTLRVPPLLTPDSQGYYLPGWELASGYGFSPELRRTPGYPLFVAAVVWLMGDDLRGLVLVQHSLGALTASLAVVLGALTFGRVAGLLAGLLVACSGPLLVYEHFVMTESLFGLALVSATLAGVAALRSPTRGRLLVAGALLAAAILTRPIAQALLPLLPLALLIRTRHPGPLARQLAWLAAGLALALVPWMARNLVVHGTFASEGALGQALIGRTVRHDKGFSYRDPPGGAAPLELEARWIIREAVAEAGDEAASGGEITRRVREGLGLTQAQTNHLLRSVALAEIARRPDYYVRGSLRMAGELLRGQPERLLGHWRQRTTRNWDLKWDPRVAHLVDHETRPEGPEYERADALVALFQPFRWARQLGVLLGLGLLASLLVRRWRVGLYVAAGAAVLILAAAFLDGYVPRYRYPVDPLLAVLVGGGASASGGLLVGVGRRLRLRLGRRARERAPGERPAQPPGQSRDLGPVGRRPAAGPS